jgi:hypothetical protein
MFMKFVGCCEHDQRGGNLQGMVPPPWEFGCTGE